MRQFHGAPREQYFVCFYCVSNGKVRYDRNSDESYRHCTAIMVEKDGKTEYRKISNGNSQKGDVNARFGCEHFMSSGITANGLIKMALMHKNGLTESIPESDRSPMGERFLDVVGSFSDRYDTPDMGLPDFIHFVKSPRPEERQVEPIVKPSPSKTT